MINSKKKYATSFKATAAVLLSTLALTGCIKKELSKTEQLTAFYLGTDTITTNISPGTNFEKYRTFSVVDPEGSPNNQLAGLAGLGPKRVLQDILELKGFEPAKEGEGPDLLVSISGNVGQSTSVISGGSGVLPMWTPGQTYNLNSYSTVYGDGTTFSGNTFGTVTGSGTTTYVPFRRPDQVVTKNNASILVQIHDYKSKKELVLYRASAQTMNSDPSLATQVLLEGLASSNIENEANHAKLLAPYLGNNAGTAGYAAILRSVDSQNMLPRVVYIVEGGAADEAGLKVGDFIISVDGKSNPNRTRFERVSDRNGKPFPKAGEVVPYEVLRGDETLKLTLKLKKYIPSN